MMAAAVPPRVARYVPSLGRSAYAMQGSAGVTTGVAGVAGADTAVCMLPPRRRGGDGGNNHITWFMLSTHFVFHVEREG